MHTPANVFLVRYCTGGAMAARLGSTELVDTIVIAHPTNLKSVDIRAIKVGNPSRNSSVRWSYFFSPQVPSCWVLAEGNTSFLSLSMCTHQNVHHLLQMTWASKIKMSKVHERY